MTTTILAIQDTNHTTADIHRLLEDAVIKQVMKDVLDKRPASTRAHYVSKFVSRYVMDYFDRVRAEIPSRDNVDTIEKAQQLTIPALKEWCRASHEFLEGLSIMAQNLRSTPLKQVCEEMKKEWRERGTKEQKEKSPVTVKKPSSEPLKVCTECQSSWASESKKTQEVVSASIDPNTLILLKCRTCMISFPGTEETRTAAFNEHYTTKIHCENLAKVAARQQAVRARNKTPAKK